MEMKYINLKEIKTISLVEIDVIDDPKETEGKFITAVDIVNKHLKEGWILLKITDKEYIMGYFNN